MTAATPFRQPFPGRISAVPTAVSTPAEVSSFKRLGFTILILYLFLIYSRIFDVKLSNLHIPGISYRVIFAMVILSQAFIKALKSDIGKAMLCFTAWFVASIPSSMWKGGSVDLLVNTWVPAFVIYLATAGLIGDYDQCRKSIHTVAYGFLVLTMIAIFWGSTEETGRLYLPHGKFSNPNEMAQALLLGLSLWWLLVMNTKSGLFKVVGSIIMLVMMFTVSKTGSRGALIAFGVLVFSIFLRSSSAGKMKILVGGVVLMAVIVGTMPRRLLNRYRTLAADQVEIAGDDESSAYASTNARKELLRKSIKYTFQHPVFGVGPGMFVVMEDADAHAEGKRKGSWQGTHNSYTQVSSELGIPGLIFYVAALFFALRKTSQIHKKTRGDPRLSDIANLALGLNYALIVFGVTIIFDHIAYTSMLPVFGGLAAALGATVDAEIARRTGGPAQVPQPEAVVPRAFRPAMATRY
jgi:O-antigen ligase